MSSNEEHDQLIPRLGFYLGIVVAAAAFAYAGSFYRGAVEMISGYVKNGYLMVLVKTGLFFTYLAPIGIAMLMINSRNRLLQAVGMIFAGLGFGIVLRVTLIFMGILDHYN